MIIYHITSRGEWEQAVARGFYEAPSLATEGFIHCCTAGQVDGVLERYFNGKPGLLKLVIDTARLRSRLTFELAPSVNETFPHIYGTLNVDAVVETEPLTPGTGRS